MRAPAFLLALLLLPSAAPAEVSLGPTEVLELVCGVGPPGLEVHPFDSGVAFVACSSEDPGASSIRIAPDAPMAFAGVDYFLPGDLDCSESLANCGNPTGFSFGSVGNLRLDPDLEGTLLARGWVTTTNCELVVPFDAISGGEWPLLYQGGDRDSVPTKRCISGDYTTYADAGLGSSIDAFATNLTSDVLRVGSRLLVSTANFSRAGSNPILFPGTVLLFDIDDSGPRTRVTPASPPFIVTSDPNPTALSPLPGGLVAVTNTGLLDVAFPPLVTGAGSIDIIDPAAGALLGSIPLGAGNPGGRSLALDPSGSIAVLGSSTLRALFAVDIRGLASLPAAEIDPRLQRPSCNGSDEDEAGGLPCLRRRVIHDFAAPLLLPPRPGASGSAGFVVEVRFSASGDFIAATSFNDGGIGLVAFDSQNLDRPHPYLPSRFGAPETLAATPPSGQFGDECCPGPMILHGDGVPGVTGDDIIWLTNSPDGLMIRGRLSGALARPGGDLDADGVEDALDTCPSHPNPAQSDADGNGVGDACQCGDLDADLRVGALDVAALRTYLAQPTLTPAAPVECEIAREGSEERCDLLDSVVLQRSIVGRASDGVQVCVPALL